ncbi:MAG: type II toxin-antitoxin system RelE/ParE family toxin [Bradyrhizobiaceae bacterium]|nr:type II toxin-antitoxin system RelE/ParE family toxin [Bradyrhizobiaceae bacterium]
MKVVFTKPALAELDTIAAYLSERNPVVAANVVAHIDRITAQLSRFPLMGHPKYKPEVRMIPLRRYPYLIFYSVEADEVHILSIRHAARRPLEDE